MNYDWGSSLLGEAVRHKVFVSYQHSRDQWYYDTFSRMFHDTYEAVAPAFPDARHEQLTLKGKRTAVAAYWIPP